MRGNQDRRIHHKKAKAKDFVTFFLSFILLCFLSLSCLFLVRYCLLISSHFSSYNNKTVFTCNWVQKVYYQKQSSRICSHRIKILSHLDEHSYKMYEDIAIPLTAITSSGVLHNTANRGNLTLFNTKSIPISCPWLSFSYIASVAC